VSGGIAVVADVLPICTDAGWRGVLAAVDGMGSLPLWNSQVSVDPIQNTGGYSRRYRRQKSSGPDASLEVQGGEGREIVVVGGAYHARRREVEADRPW
jgi:hypothetical protein